MKTAIELFLEEKDKTWHHIYLSDYQPIVEEFGNIVLQESDGGYQGSTWVLYQDGEKHGFLRFGWGSCSGCDALQACRSIDEVQSLMDYLWQSIMWFDSKDETVKFFTEHDWKGDWDYKIEEAARFVERVVEFLRPEVIE